MSPNSYELSAALLQGRLQCPVSLESLYWLPSGFSWPGVSPLRSFSPQEAVQAHEGRRRPGGQARRFPSRKSASRSLCLSTTKGRMWVIQYLQYPAPAGLKPVKVDQYLRTVYDRIPEPPPKGPKSAPTASPFFTTPMKPAISAKPRISSAASTSPPACLWPRRRLCVLQGRLTSSFYPIRDGGDVPAGDPEVLLSGFGMEDAHAVANSLQWGPDGWLYGAQGSTVTAHVRGLRNPSRWNLALSSRHQGIRAFCGGRRQHLGTRFRRPRQRHRRHQLGRLRHLASSPGRLLHQGLLQARPAAQSALLRLYRPRSHHRLQGRPRHLRRHRLPGRHLAEASSTTPTSPAISFPTRFTGTRSTAKDRRLPASSPVTSSSPMTRGSGPSIV